MHKLTEEFRGQIEKFEDFRLKIEVLIRELLIQSSLNFHKIESRVKALVKLDEKIFRKNEKYEKLQDITDLVGVRIITFFEDEVDKVAQLVESEFILDNENSIDKRKSESDRFGYKSLHYVLSLNTERKKLTEYKRFKDLKFEVQIRSILQHAWAEIEHDIGYKGELSIPDLLKRNFYRVAALLETADVEFVNIRDKLKNYEKNVAANIKSHPEEVELNAASLKAYITTSPLVYKADQEIAKSNGFELSTRYSGHLYLLEKLNFLNIRTIKDLDTALKENSTLVPLFAKEWFGDMGGGQISKGISIFYLCYVLVGKTGDVQLANEYYKNAVLKTTRARSSEVGKDIINVFKKIISKQ